MSLTIGIVGLPNVGKSTLFNALTKNDVLAANYPFATIEPNVGVVGVPDPRLNKLAEIFGSQRLLPATVDFVDIAGIVRGASEGEGLGNKFLANIRESDAICQVIRAFKDENVVHVDGKVSPKDDIETINTELILADLQSVEKAVPRLTKESRLQKEKVAVLAAVEEAKQILETGQTLFAAGITAGTEKGRLLHELHLLTVKPFLYVFNVDEDELVDEDFKNEQRALVAPAEAIFLNAKIESELIELDDDEALELLQSMGQEEPGLATLGRVGFETLGLQTYLTAGPKEARAWTIKKGATAPEAAGVIHTDFQKGFIKAEIVSFDDLVETGSVAEARAKGKARMEGKDYVMQDGDVVEFRFNV
ncbi:MULTISPECIES: redox-regulated ATPase YchF [Streptomyces]|uniref:Ribosome-binding ATPase YchF n=2 Tax=Streptomyces TaxID=1883 RepID=A0A6G3SX79_STRAQ|nr:MULTISPECIES: redox-regulated ATPase YchF [Streptomyces]NDZ58598.1 redox-regulated ATPase YchF [Streptomyces anulatus]NEB87265.1 redox-regulated ATPase YchF [Streptomyces anulatus]NEB98485.1 redox-regulated ATPase YchF [Streptomyces anulatus]NED28842.1 redox-regulated ATPase YchF [Streptomyces anulatus]OLO31157.1 GTP-binding protein YchF [Streptomyces sp. MNU77]